MTNAERQFESELEIFRTESEAATQFFYGYLAVHEVAKHHKRVFRLLNQYALFWNTVLGALQTSALIALHRIFNNRSRHNVDSLLRIAETNPFIFSKHALGPRKQGDNQIQPGWLNEYLENAYEPTTEDFRRIRGHVEKYKQIYEAKYAGLRNKVYAHKVASDSAEIQTLVAKTDIREMERLFVFLLKLHETLWQLFVNGRKPVLRPLRYSAKRMRTSPSPTSRGNSVQERITSEAEQLLLRACATQHGVAVDVLRAAPRPPAHHRTSRTRARRR